METAGFLRTVSIYLPISLRHGTESNTQIYSYLLRRLLFICEYPKCKVIIFVSRSCYIQRRTTHQYLTDYTVSHPEGSNLEWFIFFSEPLEPWRGRHYVSSEHWPQITLWHPRTTQRSTTSLSKSVSLASGFGFDVLQRQLLRHLCCAISLIAGLQAFLLIETGSRFRVSMATFDVRICLNHTVQRAVM